jgi:hypothetical protein
MLIVHDKEYSVAINILNNMAEKRWTNSRNVDYRKPRQKFNLMRLRK